MSHSLAPLLVALLVATSAAPVATAAGDVPPTTLEVVLTVDGPRWYRQALPPGHDPAAGPYPVAFLFHGGGGNALQVADSTDFVQPALDRGYVVVVPEGSGKLGGPPLFLAQTWNVGNCCGYAQENGIDDVAFFEAMVNKLVAQAAVDPARVFVTGFSNGGMLSYRIAAERPDLIAAAAPVGGSLGIDTPPVGPVPILAIHGVFDENVLFWGGVGVGVSGVDFKSQLDSILPFLNVNGGPLPLAPAVLDQALFFASPGAPGGADTLYYLALDGGHTWPGGGPSLTDPTEPIHRTPATPLVLDFFDLQWR